MKMKLLLLILILGVHCFGQVEGWDKVKWGMNKDTIKSIYPKIIESPNGELGLDNIEIAKLSFTARFEFQNDKVNIIRLIYESNNEDLTQSYFNDLESKLIEKYGQYSNKTRDNQTTSKYFGKSPYKTTTEWIFPKSTIKLIFIGLPIIKKYNLQIVYSLKEIEDKL